LAGGAEESDDVQKHERGPGNSTTPSCFTLIRHHHVAISSRKLHSAIRIKQNASLHDSLMGLPSKLTTTDKRLTKPPARQNIADTSDDLLTTCRAVSR